MGLTAILKTTTKMNIGYVFLIGAATIFLVSGALYGFKDIQIFGYILAGVCIALAIRNYYLKKK